MPIVFGGAPVVNTLVTSWINKSFAQIKPLFLVDWCSSVSERGGLDQQAGSAQAHGQRVR